MMVLHQDWRNRPLPINFLWYSFVSLDAKRVNQYLYVVSDGWDKWPSWDDLKLYCFIKKKKNSANFLEENSPYFPMLISILIPVSRASWVLKNFLLTCSYYKENYLTEKNNICFHRITQYISDHCRTQERAIIDAVMRNCNTNPSALRAQPTQRTTCNYAHYVPLTPMHRNVIFVQVYRLNCCNSF